jgi:hypothetical protein
MRHFRTMVKEIEAIRMRTLREEQEERMRHFRTMG